MSIDRYIGMYFHLQRKAEEAPLSKEELEQLALCERVLEKRRELQEFDQWLEAAFGMKAKGLTPEDEVDGAEFKKLIDRMPNCEVMTPETEKITRRWAKKMGSKKYWNLLGTRMFRGLTDEEKRWMSRFEQAFPREASRQQKRIRPDEEIDDEDD